jgi:hypothetical protein
VAAGLRLLDAGVRALRIDASDGPLAVIRRYLHALQDAPLTTFGAPDPGHPARTAPLWLGPPPIGAVLLASTFGPPPLVPVPDVGMMPEPVATAGELLREALRRLPRDRLGTRPQRSAVTAGVLALDATVTETDNPGLLDVELVGRLSEAGRPGTLAGLTVCLQVGPTLRCLATFDRTDTCVVKRVPRGPWEFTVRDRPSRSRLNVASTPLPMPTTEWALAASDTDDAAVLLRVLSPDRRTLFVMRDDSGRHLLEVSTPTASLPTLIAIEYGTITGATAVRLVPLPAGDGYRFSVAISLDGIDVGAPWHYAVLDEEYLAICAFGDLVESVRATGAHTRSEWVHLAMRLPEDRRLAVEQNLPGQRDD